MWPLVSQRITRGSDEDEVGRDVKRELHRRGVRGTTQITLVRSTFAGVVGLVALVEIARFTTKVPHQAGNARARAHTQKRGVAENHSPDAL